MELKSVAEIHQIHRAQTINYMNLLKIPRAILVNFNGTNLYHEGCESFASKVFKELPKE
ncbi:GxxExxY protein [Chryseobacterium indologenes]|uniref:GxxExxY protein n=1 Tax=Chryseobacterium indologenes TaxID=253 RepID=UPI000B28EBE5